MHVTLDRRYSGSRPVRTETDIAYSRIAGTLSPGLAAVRGQPRACQLTERSGLRVVEGDVGSSPRGPIIHVVKPWLRTLEVAPGSA